MLLSPWCLGCRVILGPRFVDGERVDEELFNPELGFGVEDRPDGVSRSWPMPLLMFVLQAASRRWLHAFLEPGQGIESGLGSAGGHVRVCRTLGLSNRTGIADIAGRDKRRLRASHREDIPRLGNVCFDVMRVAVLAP